MYNKLELNEMFGLDHRAKDERTGEIHRIHRKPDEKVPNAECYDIWLEDHTLGNSLRMELLRNEAVLFAGYKVPHPLNNMIQLRVQTLHQTTPEAAIRLAVKNLRAECRSMLAQFDKGVKALQDSQGKIPGKRALGDIVDATGASPSPDRDFSDFGEGVRSSPEIDDIALPMDVAEEQRFQEQLEQLERMGPTSASFSPPYSPTSAATPKAPMSPEDQG